MSEKNGDTPPGWTNVCLRDILHGIEAGKSFTCEPRRALPDEWGVIKVSAMTWGRFDEDENKAIPSSKDIEPRYEIRPGDVLLSRSNTVELVGASVLVNNCRTKLLLSDKSMRLLVAGAINRAWLQRVLSSPDVRKQLSSVATGSSNSMRNVSQEKVLSVHFGLPPTNEQNRIVAKIEELFSDLDAGVAALQRAKANLKRYRASVLKAAVDGSLTAEWRATHPQVEPAAKLLARILTERRQKWEAGQLAKFAATGKQPPKNWREKYVEPSPPDTTGLPKLPDGWCWASVEQISTKVVDGVHKKPSYVEKGIPFVTVRNLTAGPGISFADLKYVTPSDHEEFIKRANPEMGDLLISKDGTLGVTRAIRTNVQFSIFVSVALVKPVQRNTSDYLEIVFTSPTVQRQMVGKGSGLQHIHLEDLRQDCIPLSPATEQQVIVAEVAEHLSQIDAAEAAIEHSLIRASRLRQSILKQAFEGKLVPQDPADEPASELLERIKATRDGKLNVNAPARNRRGRQMSQTVNLKE